MQITPLRRWRILERAGKSRAKFGDRTYLTNDSSLYITHTGNGWVVNKGTAKPHIYNLAADAGLFDAVFERRKDAVAALEAVFEEVDTSCK